MNDRTTLLALVAAVLLMALFAIGIAAFVPAVAPMAKEIAGIVIAGLFALANFRGAPNPGNAPGGDAPAP